MRIQWWLGVTAALALAALLRVACLGAEFWLDEVWSWELARGAGSAAGVFAVKHDNNHHLNTLFLLGRAEGDPFWCYRLHSLVAGLVSVVVAVRVAARWGHAEAAFAAFLVAGCSWLVLASAEARGYALAVCFALAALDALWGYLDAVSRPASPSGPEGSWPGSPRQGWAPRGGASGGAALAATPATSFPQRVRGGAGPSLVAFWLLSVLGFLSHLTFAHAYLGFVVWSLRRFARERRSAGDELRRLALLHGIPGVAVAAFYLLCVRGMEVGGGPSLGVGEVVGRLVSVGLGAPEGAAPVAWIAAAVLLPCGLYLLARPGGDVWVFFAVAVVAAPALFLARRPPFLFERYFLIPFVFFLLLAARVLGELWRAEGRLLGRLAALGLLCAFLAGNAREVRRFAEAGRGEFARALAGVVADEEVTVTGDHDFRVGMLTRFYAARLADPDRVRYLGADELPAGGADYLLAHRLDDRWPPGEVQRDARGNEYRLAASYPSRGPGCWGWFVYVNARRPR